MSCVAPGPLHSKSWSLFGVKQLHFCYRIYFVSKTFTYIKGFWNFFAQIFTIITHDVLCAIPGPLPSRWRSKLYMIFPVHKIFIVLRILKLLVQWTWNFMAQHLNRRGHTWRSKPSKAEANIMSLVKRPHTLFDENYEPVTKYTL
jgi:hypothetical protein